MYSIGPQRRIMRRNTTLRQCIELWRAIRIPAGRHGFTAAAAASVQDDKLFFGRVWCGELRSR